MKESVSWMRDAMGLCEGREPFEAVTFGPETFLGALALLTTHLQGWR